MCSLRVSDKHGILSCCTAICFHFAQAATGPFRATERLGLAEPLLLINRDVLKLIVKPVNRCIPNRGVTIHRYIDTMYDDTMHRCHA